MIIDDTINARPSHNRRSRIRAVRNRRMSHSITRAGGARRMIIHRRRLIGRAEPRISARSRHALSHPRRCGRDAQRLRLSGLRTRAQRRAAGNEGGRPWSMARRGCCPRDIYIRAVPAHGYVRAYASALIRSVRTHQLMQRAPESRRPTRQSRLRRPQDGRMPPTHRSSEGAVNRPHGGAHATHCRE